MRRKIPPLTDEQIEQLILTPKPIPTNFRQWLTPRMTGGHRHCLISKTVTCANGQVFGVYARIGTSKPNDFSIGLRYMRPGKKDVGLVRCNGWHGEHKNLLERGTPDYEIAPNTFHVHVASERYLAIDKTLETIGFAIPTTEYSSFGSALEYFVENFMFVSAKTGNRFQITKRLPFCE